jgi:hypothetical protein
MWLVKSTLLKWLKCNIIGILIEFYILNEMKITMRRKEYITWLYIFILIILGVVKDLPNTT